MDFENAADLPFFNEGHRAFASDIRSWADRELPTVSHGDVGAACKKLVTALGRAGFLDFVVPGSAGGRHEWLDVRTLCLAREILAYRSGLADVAFAMQGLGSGPISLAGSDECRQRYLPGVRQGSLIAAFALSEAEAGSDVAAVTTTAEPDGSSHVRISGEKSWITNGGIADFYVVFTRTGEGPGARGLSAFVVDADMPGFHVVKSIDVIAPHPLATIGFDEVRVPLSRRVGPPGGGFKVAMATLDIFRATVAAAAVGFARRALSDMVGHTSRRKLFGAPLCDFQMTQAAIAESAAEVDAAALLTYSAAWRKDGGAERVTKEAAIAKMFSTEIAQRVIDRALQAHGGLGLTKGVKVEELYREIRALRIYEGATEVQKIIIAREMLKQAAPVGSS
jgi:acyl-CoA dehydrogenase